ncbi:MAG: glycoside hydrolase family 2, partial [Gemmatimonadota bacterium]
MRPNRTAGPIAGALAVLAALAAAPTPTPAQQGAPETIPLPEHPRPDFMRDPWVNLNGPWQFQFDAGDVGQAEGWQDGLPSPQEIVVPFPWGSALSGVTDDAQIGWYARTVRTPADWSDARVFLVIGASDWHTTAWLDGERLGEHRGGYTPFEFELTPHLVPGQEQRLVIRVDDVDREFTLEGKQGYGDARGIWQTPYLEARGA